MTFRLRLPALAVAALLALLGAAPALAGPAEDRTAAQAELSVLAQRIEQLKRDAATGQGGSAELARLLTRAQALAAQLERQAPAAHATGLAGPDAQELRERADAKRDRADKVAAALAETERQLAAISRRAELSDRLEALGATSDLFADGAAGRASAGAARATDGGASATPGGVTGASGGQGGTGAPGSTSAAPALRAAAEPGNVAGAVGTEDAGALRRRRAGLAKDLEALRAEASALDAEARAADGP